MAGLKSKKLFEKAVKFIPGGVNSPVRAFDPYPFFASHAEGSKLFDVDGNVYIDYCMAYGPLIFGHTPPEIFEAIKQQLKKGTMYGVPTEAEVELAELIVKTIPSIKMVRLVNTGTEATMHALRAARGYTGKSKIIKFEGCYHGAHDSVLVKAGSGATTFGSPTSLGIPEDVSKNTIVLPFNDAVVFEEAVEKNEGEIAAVIIEPVIGNAGVILPKEGYLKTVRRITEKHGIVLIFDEVITGFRLALGGAQEYFHITPDMTTLGKIMGGGFTIAAFGGKKEIMQLISPLGKVYQAGTLSGNPISVKAGLVTLKILTEKNNVIYKQLERTMFKLTKGLSDLAEDRRVPVQINCLASMFQIFFAVNPVYDYTSAQSSDTAKFKIYHRKLLRRGVFIPPSQFETCFISTAHTEEDVVKTLDAANLAFKSLTSGLP